MNLFTSSIGAMYVCAQKCSDRMDEPEDLSTVHHTSLFGEAQGLAIPAGES